MAFECPKPQLMIFEPKGIQYSILEKNRVELKPIASLENSRTISFLDQGYGESYRDLSSVYIQLKIQLIRDVDAAAAAPATTANAGKSKRSIAAAGVRTRRRIPDAVDFLGDTYRAQHMFDSFNQNGGGVSATPAGATNSNTNHDDEDYSDDDDGEEEEEEEDEEEEVEVSDEEEEQQKVRKIKKPLIGGKLGKRKRERGSSRGAGGDGAVKKIQIDSDDNDPILGDVLPSTTIASKDIKVSVVNNLMHSLFNQIILTLNGKQVSQNCQNYAYRAYLENLLNFNEEAASQHLDGIIWSLDTPGAFNELNGKNAGFVRRGQQFGDNGEVVELCGRLHLDMLNTTKYLINNVDFGLTFELAKQSFCMLTDDNDKSSIKLLNASLFIDHVRLNPEVLLSHQRILEQKNAIYNYKKVDVRNFGISPQGNSFAIDNIHNGALPELILFMFVDTLAYNGERHLNPFNFEHMNISQISLHRNGKNVDPQILEFNYESKNPMSSHGYFSLFKQLNLHRFDRANQISREFFDNGGFIVGYDLTQDRDNECGNVSLPGTLRLEVKLSRPLTRAITVLAYLQSDADLIIDRDRNVFTQTF